MQRELDAICERAEKLRQAGNFIDALVVCDQALARAPVHSRALSERAHALRLMGRAAEAKESAERALESDQDNAAAWFNLGAALATLEQPLDAERAYRKSVELRPRYAEAWSNLGNLLHAQQRIEAALDAYQKGIAAKPNLAPIWANLGNALCDLRRSTEAVDACREAVKRAPDFATGWAALSRALLESGRHDDSIAAARRALELAPGLPQAWSLLGSGLYEVRNDDEAVAACERAVALDPGNVSYLFGLGNALQRKRRWSDALAAYDRALECEPNRPDVHVAVGLTHWRQGAFDRAIQCYRRALEIQPDHGYAAWNLAGALLGLGRLDAGWRYVEARWRLRDARDMRYAWKRPPKFSRRGIDFSDASRVLIWGEQGLGDEILYAPMAAEVAARGIEVTLETEARLVPLFARSFDNLNVIAMTESLLSTNDFDYVLPLASLGATLRTSFDAFPVHDGYLLADARRVSMYRKALEAISKPSDRIIGISWRSKVEKVGAFKSIPLGECAPILAVANATFVSLQYGDTEAERVQTEALCGVRVSELPEPNLFSDIDGLAALITACDAVITSSSVVAHLAGALGRPGILMLPREEGRHWYWFRDRDTSPWYPSLYLLTQETDGDWTEVVARAADWLANFSRTGKV